MLHLMILVLTRQGSHWQFGQRKRLASVDTRVYDGINRGPDAQTGKAHVVQAVERPVSIQ